MNAVNPPVGSTISAVNGSSSDWVRAEAIRSLPIDQARGVGAMAWFIASEAMVFVGLFFSYFYLGHVHTRWPPDSPPHIALASAMMGTLIVSCIVLWWGRTALEWRVPAYDARAGLSAASANSAGRQETGARGSQWYSRMALLITILLGCVFLILSAFDYNDHVRDLPATTDSYSSIFYVIDGVHVAHLMLGLLMLAYAFVLPELGPTERPPHTPYRTVAMYWYFVTVVYAAMYCILYLVPNL